MIRAIRSSDAERAATLPPAVAEIGKIHFEGNLIPHQWYQRVTLASGKPDMPAITILSEIVYWYRPYQILTKGGKPILRKHFDGDRFQCTAAYFVEKFGFTKDQTRKALKRLEDAGYIHREYRDIVQQGILRNCITFVEPVPSAIMAITHPDNLAETGSGNDVPPSPVGDPPSPVGDPPSPVGVVYKGIKITTEISTETTTTPNPSSSNEATATTDSARGGGIGSSSAEIRAGDPAPAVTGATTEEKATSGEEAIQHAAITVERGETPTEHRNPVSGRETPDERRPELAFPAKLTESEYADIAAQVKPLPPVIAQQMLDVVDAKIKAGQIKTSPASVLRGIVRKYRADSSSFDPSMGFAIADARRRRAEAEAQAKAAVEQREREREASRITPETREVAHRSIAHIKQLLRGHA